MWKRFKYLVQGIWKKKRQEDEESRLYNVIWDNQKVGETHSDLINITSYPDTEEVFMCKQCNELEEVCKYENLKK